MGQTRLLLGLVLIFAAALISGCVEQGKTSGGGAVIPSSTIDYSHQYPSSEADVAGFEMKKTGIGFVVYYHSGEDTTANKVMAVLEQAGTELFKENIGATPEGIQVYVTSNVDEYVRIANFPGGKENVAAGDGSAPNGIVYLYRPFEGDAGKKAGGVIIHEGAHAAVYQLLGSGGVQYLPGFLNEGIAYYNEYVFKAGTDFDPLDQIYHSDLLIAGVRTGDPALMSLLELGESCEGYISDETLNFLCRGQGTFTVWHISRTYGEDAIASFLADLKQTKDWQVSLASVAGKTVSLLGQDVQEHLESAVQQNRG